MKQSGFLCQIREKVLARVPLSADEGLRLFHEPDLNEVGAVANSLRELLHAQHTYYNRNLHLNVTNVCESGCRFCSFSRQAASDDRAYTMTIPEARQWIADHYRPGMTEIHIVNGLNPDMPFPFYLALLEMIRTDFPELHIKAFSAVEIHYFSKATGLSYAAVLEALCAAGLGSLPGGGAEIFSSRVRRALCPNKANAEEWLLVHRIAHQLGLKSNCTMLYGTIETYEERIDHLLRLRALQDETQGFQCFVPLAFQNAGKGLPEAAPLEAGDHLRTIAVSRLMLCNIPHIKAYWVSLGVATAQRALSFGADDLDGTVSEERVHHMAGATAPLALTVEQIRAVILRAGRVPVERTTLYAPLRAAAS